MAKHFLNTIHCTGTGHDHPNGSYSCAVDVFLEIFHFALYRRNTELFVSGCANPLQAIMVDISIFRIHGSHTTCILRNLIWCLLVTQDPGSFAPKGRGDAELRGAFHMLTQEANSAKWVVGCRLKCESCNFQREYRKSSHLVEYLYTDNKKAGGDISLGLEYALRSKDVDACDRCKSKKVTLTEQKYSPSGFIVIQLGLHNDFTNTFEPRTCVREQITVYGTRYTLSGAVQMNGNHFYAIVSSPNGYSVIDGLCNSIVEYSSFGEAVTKTKSYAPSDVHFLDNSHAGVCNLIYIKYKASTNGHLGGNSSPQSTNPPVTGTTYTISPSSSMDSLDRLVGGPLLRGTLASKSKVAPPLAVPNSNNPAKCGSESESEQVRDSGTLPSKQSKVAPPLAVPNSNQITIDGYVMPFEEFDSHIFFAIKPVLSFCDLWKQCKSKGYGKITSIFNHAKLKLDTCFRFSIRGKLRTHISLEAFLCLTDQIMNGKNRDLVKTYLESMPCPTTSNTDDSEPFFKLNGIPIKHLIIHDCVFFCGIDFMTAAGYAEHYKHHKFHVVKKYLHAKGYDLDVSFSGGNKTDIYLSYDAALGIFESKTKTIYDTGAMKEEIIHHLSTMASSKLSVRPSSLDEYVSKTDNAQIVNQISGLFIKPGVQGKPNLPLRDSHLQEIIEQVRKKKPAFGRNTVKKLFCEMYPITNRDLINIEENYAGVRLIRQLRKFFPNVPSYHVINAEKKNFNTEFEAVLKPHRIASGWAIDVSGLLKLLRFRYPYVSNRHIRIYGDARVIGGRTSTVLNLSFVNNELLLHGEAYQNPNAMYSFAIFYESDTRDNLEENVTAPVLDSLYNSLTAQDQLYLAGDEMFLEHILDDEDKLSPTSVSGWNVYSETDKDSKGNVHPRTKLRTDLDIPFDRLNPNTLFQKIPLKNTVLCLLHGTARVIEKLIDLELADMYSETLKNSSYFTTERVVEVRESMINLEANINERGVRQGNFQIPMDEQGKPKPISLNKDHALTIIIPPPPGNEKEFPHVLDNVLLSERKVVNAVPKKVRNYIGQTGRVFYQLPLVKTIWHAFYEMYTLLRNEPPKTLKQGSPEGSLLVEDYLWGYSASTLAMYQRMAETFYQLFRVRYGHSALTPYMMKFIDYGGKFLRDLPVPFCRFQTEGGEHSHYQQQRFYMNHTTRHGGNNKTDPILSVLRHEFRSLSYAIVHPEPEIPDDDITNQPRKQFVEYVEAAVSELKAQRAKTGRKAPSANPISPPTIMKTHQTIFKREHFVLVGNVTKVDGKKISQDTLAQMIKEKGGRIKKKLPPKYVSTKKYTVLVDKARLHTRTAKTVENAIKLGIRFRHNIVAYPYVIDSIAGGQALNRADYKVKCDHLTKDLKKSPCLREKHFPTKPSMFSIIKKGKLGMKRVRRVQKIKQTFPASAAHYYSFTKRRKLTDAGSYTFKECSYMMAKFMREWKLLSACEKNHHTKIFEMQRQKHRLQIHSSKDLKKYNNKQYENWTA